MSDQTRIIEIEGYSGHLTRQRESLSPAEQLKDLQLQQTLRNLEKHDEEEAIQVFESLGMSKKGATAAAQGRQGFRGL